jgi:cation transport ATPase
MERSQRIDSASIEPARTRPPARAGDDRESGHALSLVEAVRIVLVALCAAAVWLHWWEPFARVSLIGALGVTIGGWPIFKEAAANVAARRMTMELSMAVAIVAAAAISEYFTALVITLFVLVAEVSTISWIACRVRSRCAARAGCARSRPASSRLAMPFWSIPAAQCPSTAWS